MRERERERERERLKEEMVFEETHGTKREFLIELILVNITEG